MKSTIYWEFGNYRQILIWNL